MNEVPLIFVIVVTYKGMQWYDKCFSSLKKSSVPLNIIVVDNSPTAEDANYIQSHFPEIKIIRTGENLGFGKSNNIALRYALEQGCDYVFLLNQDTWMLDDAMISKLIAISKNNPSYGILSPLHVQKDGETLGMMYEHQNHRCSQQLVQDLLQNSLKEAYETDYINAAGWLLPRHTLETIGGFDPIFQHYGEDDNYLSRLRFHGLKVVLCPRTRMVHDHIESDLPFSNQKWLYYHRKELLANLTDVNIPNALFSYYKYFLRKFFVYIFSAKKMERRALIADMKFVYQQRKNIKISRTQNSTEGRSWL